MLGQNKNIKTRVDFKYGYYIWILFRRENKRRLKGGFCMPYRRKRNVGQPGGSNRRVLPPFISDFGGHETLGVSP